MFARRDCPSYSLGDDIQGKYACDKYCDVTRGPYLECRGEAIIVVWGGGSKFGLPFSRSSIE